MLQDSGTKIGFKFITRCYTKAITEMLIDIQKGRKVAPDIIILNSCLWDLTRYDMYLMTDSFTIF